MTSVLHGMRSPSDEEAIEDVAAAAGATQAERDIILLALCRMAAEQTAQHRDPGRVLAWQDPLPASSVQLLARLRDRFHGG